MPAGTAAPHTLLLAVQVMAEVQTFLKMLHEVYTVFGLDYSMALSTRPEGYLGELELWNKVTAWQCTAAVLALPACLLACQPPGGPSAVPACSFPSTPHITSCPTRTS
jgi:hypothetical protein